MKRARLFLVAALGAAAFTFTASQAPGVLADDKPLPPSQGTWRQMAPAPPTGSAPSCGTTVPKAGGGTWQCTFADGFGGRELDREKWFVQTTAFSGYTTGAADCYVDSPRNVHVRNGVLNLVAHREAAPFTCKSPNGDFTSQHTAATVLTWRRFAQTYGRYEFRARFPATTQPGLHGALWLYPETHRYGPWPSSGEIDVAEYFTAVQNQVFPSLHYDGSSSADTGWNCPVADPSAFHTYVLEWTPQTMSFIYDGRLCFQRAWTPAEPLVAPQPFDLPFYVVMTQAVGAEWNSPNASTPFPGGSQIDWVRVWK